MDDIWACRVSWRGDVAVVVLSGEVDMSAQDELAEVLLAEVHRPGVTAVRVDLDAVRFLDSSAINVLVRVLNAARTADRDFRLVRAHRSPLKVLQMTGLLPLLAADDDTADGDSSDGELSTAAG